MGTTQRHKKEQICNKFANFTTEKPGTRKTEKEFRPSDGKKCLEPNGKSAMIYNTSFNYGQ